MIARNNIASITLFSLSLLIFSGCSQHYVAGNDSRQARAVPYTIVSSGNPNVDIASSTHYSFIPNMHETHGMLTLGGVPVKVFLEGAVNDAMNAKGYPFSRVTDKRSLLVGYQLALGKAGLGDQLSGQYGLQPGLTSTGLDAQHYEKGTLIITVTENRSGRIVLRSALQGFADLSIPAGVRQQRINDIVLRMLSGLPSRAN